MYFYSFHIGDFIKKTIHLSDAEELAYRRLLDWYYMHEEPLPPDVDKVAKIARTDSETALTVLKEFFTECPQGWCNQRCDDEIAKYYRIVEQRKEAGKASGKARREKSKEQELNDCSTNDEREANGEGTKPEQSEIRDPGSVIRDPLSNDPRSSEDINSRVNSTPPYLEIISYLNNKTGKRFRHTGKTTQKHIKARWNEGFRIEHFKQVINNMCDKWLHDPKMIDYLRPSTLFGEKFEGYLYSIGGKLQKKLGDKGAQAYVATGQWMQDRNDK